MRFFLPALLALTACASCRLPEDSSSIAAAQAGQATVVLGACQSGFNLGWQDCLLERHSPTPFPPLSFVMTNPGEWAVSDCEMGMLATGAASAPGIVQVDLEKLHAQAERLGFCLLKVETVEKWGEAGQTHSLYMRGGFFLELVEPGFFPVPAAPDVAFCLRVERTTKGRTKVSKCQAQ